MRVVAAVTPRSVVEEYESVVREAGYNPGAVLPSMIAALGVVDGARPTMVIKVESREPRPLPSSTRTSCCSIASLENGGTAVTGESLVDDVNTSLVYFEDRYGISVDRVLVTGVQSAQALQAAFGNSNIRVEELISSSVAGAGAGSVARSALAGVAGALVS